VNSKIGDFGIWTGMIPVFLTLGPGSELELEREGSPKRAYTTDMRSMLKEIKEE
jgi:hypothetical protein